MVDTWPKSKPWDHAHPCNKYPLITYYLQGTNLGFKDKECLLFITDPNLGRTLTEIWVSLVAQMIKNLPVMQETWVRSLGQEVPLEKEMVTHSSILAWRIPWTEELGKLQSMGLQRVRHDWATNTLWLNLIFLSTFCIRGYIILYNIYIYLYYTVLYVYIYIYYTV